jgi:3-hydroxyisobutyrate dehydrogenase
MATLPIVGFVGLGDQGSPIARRIVEAGYPLHIFARRPEALAPFADTAAVASGSLAELARAADIVGVCVRTDADVESVALGPDGLLAAMRPGTTLLIHSTVMPDLCQAVAAVGAERSVHVLDAPVSGGRFRAAEGKMTVMVGGNPAVFEGVRPMLTTFATTIERVGDVGAGQLAKLVNNVVFTVNLGTALAGLDTGERLFGLDRAALARILSAGSAQSMALDVSASQARDAFAGAHSLLDKDVRLFLDVVAGRGGSDQPFRMLTDVSLRALIEWER